MDKVQNKPNSSVQHTPSSESFQNLAVYSESLSISRSLESSSLAMHFVASPFFCRSNYVNSFSLEGADFTAVSVEYQI
jgi:hypothetical protein